MLQLQNLLSENQELKQIIAQKNQVIAIKDNTIEELKHEYGTRSSQGLTVSRR